MLVLTRRQQESVIIGENGEIKITVLRINGNQVKIGIDAPKELPINREEIYERINAADQDNITLLDTADREVA